VEEGQDGQQLGHDEAYVGGPVRVAPTVGHFFSAANLHYGKAKYQELINALSMSHSRKTCVTFWRIVVDPAPTPHIEAIVSWTFHLMDRMVRTPFRWRLTAPDRVAACY
jgi:hypothetical protein